MRLKYKILFLSLVCYFSLSAQQLMQLNLDDALRLAQTQSLQSFLVKNTYLADYWQYKSYKANFLPSLEFRTNLVSYTNANQLRYNSVTETEDFVRTQTLNSDASLMVIQNVGVTGGTFFMQTDLDRNENFGSTPYTQFSSRPFRIGYQQELFGYNEFKWDHKLEPKKYEKAMLQYLHDVEFTNMKTCQYFFALAMANMEKEMADYNLQSIDTLLNIAERRFELGTVDKAELMELRLNQNNAQIRVEESLLQYRKEKEAFITFLRLPSEIDPQLLLPEAIDLQIPEEEALRVALDRNAQMIEHEINVLSSEQEVAEMKAKNRFQANLSISYGINKADGYYDYNNDIPVNGSIGNVYRPDFDDYQQLGISLNVPILDWGKRKGQFKMAQSRQEITRIAVEQAIQSFEQEVITKVLGFNLQYNKVQSASRSDQLALESYQLTEQRFRKGNVDVQKLTLSQQAKDNASLKYISSLYQYWLNYYEVRHFTLFDFRKNVQLVEDFEALLKN
ncbi:TolC family protein [Carboxylicivirga sp. N1Y90]|uniref:TolC family protein n=1 Tax=Carboxylicivirga fragile TaxID=3417571 RepID=UPI003D32D34E|nr:TolC family protein [Marinilabiliaceae bacterium N1Y90]